MSSPEKPDVLQQVERLVQPRGDQIVAMGRKVPDKELKRGSRIEVLLDIPCGHREFIEIREEAGKMPLMVISDHDESP